MYFFCGYIFMLLSFCPSTFPNEKLLYSAKKFPERMLALMDNYEGRAKTRIDEILHIRGSYEISPHFEYGYVTCEILERYRKMVGIVQRPIVFKSDAVFDTMKRTELVQKLFFDILHLSYMIHEIPQKYSHMKEFQNGGEKPTNISVDFIEESKKYREWIKKKHQKEKKKEREMIKKGILKDLPRKVKPKNKWWPIDYGWEIDYEW